MSKENTLILDIKAYSFDGLNFENISKISLMSHILDLKEAIIRGDSQRQKDSSNILKNDYPQLYEFMRKQRKSFEN